MAQKNGSLFDYQYNLTDHLGNVRNVLNASNVSIQSNDYYPFGLTHTAPTNFAKNKYLYNGKEAQDETIGGTTYNVLDYHARRYDPVIGRMTEPDPMQEKYVSISPFAYAVNNPVYFIDPTGEEIYIYYEEEYINKKGKVKTRLSQQPHLFDPNKGYDGDNKFIKSVYEAYNYMKENGIDMKPFDTFIGNENIDVNITDAKFNRKGNFEDQGLPNRKYELDGSGEKLAGNVYWNPDNGLKFDEGVHPPSLGLLHEIGQVYRGTIIGGNAAMDELKKPTRDDWMYEGEKWVIETIESPAAKKLGLQSRNRYKYTGGYKATGVNSTIEYKKSKKKK